VGKVKREANETKGRDREHKLLGREAGGLKKMEQVKMKNHPVTKWQDMGKKSTTGTKKSHDTGIEAKEDERGEQFLTKVFWKNKGV